MFIKWVSWNENVKMDKWKYKERPWNIGIWNEEIPIKIETTIDKRERERERERVMVWLCAKRVMEEIESMTSDRVEWWKIGDGTQVKFWQDRWCLESSLAVCYPKLFRICHNWEVSVADLMQLMGFLIGIYTLYGPFKTRNWNLWWPLWISFMVW